MQQLNELIADEQTSQEQKDLATNELREKTMIAYMISTAPLPVCVPLFTKVTRPPIGISWAV